MMQNKDSISNTFQVAGVLCLVCALLVSATALGLRDLQKTNVALDKKKNILQVAGYSPEAVEKLSSAEIDAIFDGTDALTHIEDMLVELATGEILADARQTDLLEKVGLTDGSSLEEFDQELLVKDKQWGTDVSGDVNIGLRRRETVSHVYRVTNKKKNEITRYVFPVKGKGLWSTLMGYLAVDANFEKIEGLTFYSHKETPGLGGEVDNPKWKKLWEGRLIRNDSGELPKDYVVKGAPGSDNKNAVSGLSGATITSKGVSNLVKYWLGDNGFGKFIDNTKK